MKKVLFAFAVFVLAAVACNKDKETVTLTVDFSISANPCYAEDEVTFTASVAGGKAPYTYAWTIGDDVALEGQTAAWTPSENGTYVVKLVATDVNGAKGERSKNLVVNPAEVQATGQVTLLWTCQLEGYTSITTPAVADDGSIYTATRDYNHFYKISKDGAIVWTKTLLNNPQSGSQIYGTPSIDTDGTIYMCGGTKNGDATLVAYNPDGTEKWRFVGFWNKGNAHQAAINGATHAGIGTDNVYIGNVGSTGTIISVSKADGTRVNYLKDASSGGGPAGGCRGGVVVSNNGYVGWCGGAYGIFGASTAALDVAGEGAAWAWRSCYSAASGWPIGNNQSNPAVMQINGKDALVGMQAIKNSETNAYAYTKVYGIDFVTGEEIVSARVDACAQQDQGGISITADGLIIVPLKYNLGQADGGIALVDPVKNEMVGHYGIGENVSSAPAVDAAGNIHFGTEIGNYYVVKYKGNGEFETLVKKNFADIVVEDPRYAQAFEKLLEIDEGERIGIAKIWSGIVIGDDGTIYVQFTVNNERTIGGLAAITIDYCTGPSSSSPWPMMGQNRKHTNHQK